MTTSRRATTLLSPGQCVVLTGSKRARPCECRVRDLRRLQASVSSPRLRPTRLLHTGKCRLGERRMRASVALARHDLGRSHRHTDTQSRRVAESKASERASNWRNVALYRAATIAHCTHSNSNLQLATRNSHSKRHDDERTSRQRRQSAFVSSSASIKLANSSTTEVSSAQQQRKSQLQPHSINALGASSTHTQEPS